MCGVLLPLPETAMTARPTQEEPGTRGAKRDEARQCLVYYTTQRTGRRRASHRDRPFRRVAEEGGGEKKVQGVTGRSQKQKQKRWGTSTCVERGRGKEGPRVGDTNSHRSPRRAWR